MDVVSMELDLRPFDESITMLPGNYILDVP